MTLAERFDAWALQHEERGMRKGIEQGIQQGIQKGLKTGILQGEALVLQRLLAKRFGPLPAEATARISTATAPQLETWLDRLLDAQSWQEVLRP